MIRAASIYDKEQINELGSLLNDNFATTYNLNEMLEDDVTKVIVYENAEKIIGLLIATDLGETCDILSVVVDPKYRRQNIASNLITYLFSELSPNLSLVTLEVASKNKAALKLYEKFGFEVVNIRKNYYKDDDAFLMARKREENE